ncbi:MAG: hypothetical protein V4456_12155 [Bacteroidota bacterium]
MKTAFYLFVLMLALCYNANGQGTKTEGIILDKVATLPEVRSFIKTAKASHPALMIAGQPDKDFKYYWVKVGINNFDMFRTNYNFYVDPKTYEIFYFDTMADEGPQVISLKLWRRWYHTKGYNQMHTYKAGRLIVLSN